MIAVFEFCKKHRVVIGVVLIIVGAFFVGLGVGRGHGTVIEKEVIKTQVQEHVVYKDRVVTQKVYVQVEKKHEHVETTTTKEKDGTVVTKTTKDTNVDDNTNVNTNKTDDKNVTQDKVVVQTVEKLKIVDKELKWRIGAGVGYSLASAFGGAELGMPGMKGFVVQAHADRHIAGPIWLGVFANTQATAGLDLSVEW